MITLFHAPTTRSFRIYWLLLELDIKFELKRMNYYTGDRNDPNFRRVNPMGSLPAILDDEGLPLVESEAIINYVLARHGGGRFQYPVGSREWALVGQWMAWSESLFAIHQRTFWDHCTPPPACVEHPIPKLGIEGRDAALACLPALEAGLSEDGFAVGSDLTGADFMLSFPLYLADRMQWFAGFPRIQAYIDRIKQRPKFREAVADTDFVVADFKNNYSKSFA